MSTGEGISGNSSKRRESEDRRVPRKIFDSAYSPNVGECTSLLALGCSPVGVLIVPRISSRASVIAVGPRCGSHSAPYSDEVYADARLSAPDLLQKGSGYIALRPLHRCASLGRIAKRAAYGAGDALHSLRPARGGHSQEPLRLVGSRRHGLLADSVRLAHAALAGAPETARV